MNDVVINGVSYPVDEIYTRTLLVHGAQPTDFEDYQYINVLVNHTNKNKDAGGLAQAEYRYSNLEDLHKFHDHRYPYYLECKMVTASDRRGNQMQVIVSANFDNVKEMEIVERKKSVSATTANTPKTTNS